MRITVFFGFKKVGIGYAGLKLSLNFYRPMFAMNHIQGARDENRTGC
jgi:hypothetical protein